MPPASRDHARIERRLIAALTDACEIAKAEMTKELTERIENLTTEMHQHVPKDQQRPWKAVPKAFRIVW